MVLYALPHNNHPQMNLRERYLVYLLIIEQWIIWIGYLIWTLSYAKLFFIGRLLVFNGRQGRMINAVSCSRKRRELSAMTRKFGRLLIRFSHILIFVWVWYRIGKDQSVMILIALRWIYLGGRCYRIQVGFVSFVFIRPVFFILDLSVERIFRMLPLLFLVSGRTYWHSLWDLELVSDFEEWVLFFPVVTSIHEDCVLIFFLESSLSID